MKRLLSLIIVLCFLLLSACSKGVEANDYYSIKREKNGTYSYIIRNKSGKTIVEETELTKEPKINLIEENILKISFQAGTGLSTRWTCYVNVLSGEKSGYYYSVLGEYNGKVIYPNTSVIGTLENNLTLLIHGYFDMPITGQEISLNDVADCVDPFLDFTVNDDGTAEISYLSGDSAIIEKTVIFTIK